MSAPARATLEPLEPRLLLTTNWSGDIPNGTVWHPGDVQFLLADVRVPAGCTLTIEPGAVVKGKWFTDPSILVEGTLLAQGTAGSPIIFTGERDDTAGGDTNGDGSASVPGPGQWGRIEFRSTSTGSVLDHVEVRYGGYGSAGAVTVSAGQLTLSNSLVSKSSVAGLRITGANPTVTGNTFQDNSGAAVSMDLASNPAISGVTATNNAVNGLLLDGGTLPGDAFWNDPDIVYELSNSVTVPAGRTLTVGAGQIVKGKWFTAPSILVEGSLVAQGTAASPIIFTGERDDTAGGDTNNDAAGSAPGIGQWGRIELKSTSTGSVLDHAEVRYGGGGSTGAVTVSGGQLTLSNSLVSKSSVAGLRITGANPTVTNNTFQDNTGAAVSMDLASNPAIAGVTLTNNAVNGVVLDAGTLPGNAFWDDPDIAYRLSGDVTVPLGATLTLASGQVVKGRTFWTDKVIVAGTLAADGTANSPIVFTSDRDDTAGGDTNNDGAGTAPSRGTWGGIQFTATSTGSLLDHVEVRYAGNGVAGAVIVSGGQLTLTNSVVQDSGSAGVRIVASSPVLTATTYLRNWSSAVSMDLASNPAIAGVTVTGNGVNGLVLDAGTLPGNAFWDDPDIVYRLSGDVTVPQGSTLTLAAGQVVKGRALWSDDVIVQGRLLAEGTPAAPIVFTSDRDDTAGGDTNNDGAATAPARGNWGAIQFAATSTGSLLDHAETRYGGLSAAAAVVVSGCSVAVTSSVIRHSSAHGVCAQNNAQVQLTSNVIVQNNGAGVRAESGASVTVVNNTIDGNNPGVHADAASAVLTNNLISVNTTAGVRASGAATVTLAYNDVFNPSAANGNYYGLANPTGQNGNLSADPLYTSRGTLDFTLQAGSPAIDAATSDGAPALDFLRHTRYDSPTVANTGGGLSDWYDMGAIEFGGQPVRNIDLAVSNVSGPASGPQDGDVTVHWTVQNQGGDPATGSWYDSIYLSQDAVWSSGDRLLGSLAHAGGLAAGAPYDAQATFHVQGVPPGDYRYLVVTDVRHESAEGGRLDNNAAASTATVSFAMPQLSLGTPLADHFSRSGEARFYRVAVPAGQNLRAALDDADNIGRNELYVSYGAPPVPGASGQRYAAFGGADETVFVPSAAGGDWYVLAYSAYGSGDFTVVVEATQVTLTAVAPPRIGNAAPMVLTLGGAGYVPGTLVALVSASQTVYAAASAEVDSFRQITATFAAGAVPAGMYTVRVTAPGSPPAELAAGLEVIAGGKANLSTRVIVPGTVGYHAIATVYVEYTNTGDLAMPAPLLVLTATQNGQQRALLTLDRSRVTEGFWTSAIPEGFANFVEILGSGQVPGVLLPGETGRAAVYYAGWQKPWDFSYPPIDFRVGAITADNAEPLDWNLFKETVRPPTIGGDAWQVIWSNLTAQGGDTWGDYVTMLSENATYLGRLGQNVTDVSALLEFEFQQANGLSPYGTLAVAVDASVPAPGITLGLERSFPGSIPGRYSLGPLGRGWSHNWEVSLTRAADGTVHVATPGLMHRIFQPDSRGGFFAQPGDYGVLTALPDGTFVLREQNGLASAFRADGKLDHVEDVNGNRITCGYTGDLLTSLTHSSGQVLLLAYNAAGRIERVTDPDGRQTLFTYDAANEHLIAVQDPAGRVVQYAYSSGQGAAVEHALSSVAYPDGTHDFFAYDGHGWLVGMCGDGGADPVTLTRDAGKVSVTDSTGATAGFFYDCQGRLVKMEDPSGRAVSLSFDANDRLVAFTDSAGRVYEHAYDAAGRLIRSTDPLGRTVTHAYASPSGPADVSSITDANGNVTRRTYDSRGNLRSITYADGTSESFTYDGAGRPISWTNCRGQKTQYAYDAEGRLTAKVYPDGSRVDYVYDSRGNLTSAADAGGTTTLEYNAGDYLTRITYPGGKYLQFTYDALGRRTSSTDQAGYTLNYQVDSAGRLERITDGAGAAVVAYAYNAAGQLAREDRGNGTYTTWSYDALGRLDGVANYSPLGVLLSRFQYGYDDDGGIAGMETLDGRWTYEYDVVGRLVGAAFDSTNPLVDDQDFAYEYDAAGNRLRTVANGQTVEYAANPMNQYLQAGDAAFTYTPDGGMAQRTGPGGATTYTYDYENRLVAVSSPAGTWQYTYDALGNRVAVTMDGVTTRYVFDPVMAGSIMGEYDAGGALVAHYGYGLGLVSRTNAAGQSAYYAFDALGSTRQITDAAGQVVTSYDYDPFGNVLGATGSAPNPFQYVGRFGVTADGTGLYHMRARSFDPALGRFTQADPIGPAGGLNLYDYCQGNPVSLKDPSGLQGGFYEGMVLDTGTYLSNLRVLILARYAAYYTPAELVGVSKILQAYNLGATEWLARSLGVDTQVQYWNCMTTPPNYLEQQYAALEQEYMTVETARRATPAAAGGGTAWYLGYGQVLWAYASQPAGAWLTTGGAVAIGGKVLFLGAWAYGWYRVGRWLGDETFIGDWAQTTWDALNRASGNRLYAAYDWLFGPEAASGVSASRDPNQKTGPSGVAGGFVGPGTVLPYRVDFENESSATAPAQVVTVTDPLDPNLDWTTFEWTEVGFGDHLIPVTGNGQHFAVVEPITYNGQDLEVHIDGTIDLGTGVARVTFSTLDPETLLPPSADVGFLPPEDESGRGMGYACYVVRPRSGLATGTPIRNVAEIAFDFGEVIATNQVDPHDPSKGADPNKECLLLVDGIAPVSQITTPDAAQGFGTTRLTWQGQDDAGGAGVATYDIYVSIDGAAYQLAFGALAATSVEYVGQPDHTYSFYSVATDKVGNREDPPPQADATIALWPTEPMVFNAKKNKWSFTDEDGTPVTVSWTGKGTVTIERWRDPANGRGNIRAITIDGSDAASGLTIATTGRNVDTAVEGITVHGPMGTIAAATTDLLGLLEVQGTLLKATFDEATGATIRIGGTPTSKPATLVFDQVKDTGLVSAMPLASLTAAEWLDTDGVLQEIRAPWIGTLSIAGKTTVTPKIAGDFAANLTLSGNGVAAKAKTLGAATVKGGVAPCTWDITGTVGAIKVAGMVGAGGQPWILKNAAGVASLTLGDVVDADVSAALVGAVKAIRWLDGSVTADRVTSIATTGMAATKMMPAFPGDFGADVTLSGAGVTGTAKTLGGATIKGSVAPSTWDITGPVGAVAVTGNVAPGLWDLKGPAGAIKITGAAGAAGQPWVLKNSSTVASLTLGDVIDAEVQGAAAIGAVKAVRWQAGVLQAKTVASIATTGLKGKTPLDTLSGDFKAGVTLAGVVPVAGKKQPMTLGSMTVAGWLADMTLGFTGPLGKLTMGGMRNADILAADPADATMSIAGLTIKGATGAPADKWFINSNVLANKLAAVAVIKVQADNSANNPAAFGIKARTITSYTCDKMKHVAVGNLLDSHGDYTVELLP
jgi:RHS repeat-associated protein